MGRTKRVVIGFAAFGEPAQPVFLAQSVHPVAAACQDFVRITLMPHIPDQLVARRVEDRVNGNGQFDHTQRRSKMPARFADGMYNFAADFIGEDTQFRIIKAAHI